MSSPSATVQEFVSAFMEAWPKGDAARVAAFFSEDAVYHNGPIEPVQGRKAIEATLAAFMRSGCQVEVDMIHIMANDAVVMTERVDRLLVDAGTTISLPVMGRFEVHNGLITAWRDYFDLNDFTSQMSDLA